MKKGTPTLKSGCKRDKRGRHFLLLPLYAFGNLRVKFGAEGVHIYDRWEFGTRFGVLVTDIWSKLWSFSGRGMFRFIARWEWEAVY